MCEWVSWVSESDRTFFIPIEHIRSYTLVNQAILIVQAQSDRTYSILHFFWSIEWFWMHIFDLALSHANPGFDRTFSNPIVHIRFYTLVNQAVPNVRIRSYTLTCKPTFRSYIFESVRTYSILHFGKSGDSDRTYSILQFDIQTQIPIVHVRFRSYIFHSILWSITIVHVRCYTLPYKSRFRSYMFDFDRTYSILHFGQSGAFDLTLWSRNPDSDRTFESDCTYS